MLTKEKDSLDAFMGICHFVSRTEDPVHHIYAIDFLVPQDSSTDELHGGQAERETFEPAGKTNEPGEIIESCEDPSEEGENDVLNSTFIIGLIWMHDESQATSTQRISRCAQFPIWAWAGWEDPSS